jgi:hypothetical protein
MSTALLVTIIGNDVQLRLVLTSLTGQPMDADTVAFYVIPPDGVVEGPFSAYREGTGIYHYNYTPTQTPLPFNAYVGRVEATNPNVAEEADFTVRASRFRP